MTKKQTAAQPPRHDHSALFALSKANPTLRWQFKGRRIDGEEYWQTLAPNRKPQFWQWKEYRVAPTPGVSAEEKEAVLAPVAPHEDTVDVLRKIMRALQNVGLVQVEDAPGNEEFITMDMTERQRVILIASIKYVTRNGKDVE